MKITQKAFLYIVIILASNNFQGFSQETEKTFLKSKFISSFVKPDKIKELGPNHYFIDFGKDAFGTLILNFKSSKPDTVIIHLGEKSINSSAVDRNPGGTIRYQKVILAVSPSNESFTIQQLPDKFDYSSINFICKHILLHS